ncbi:hypothetical protein HN51_014440 [Arachis hypogaea]|uniref:dof zinc finger protein DOF2.5 n=1 Tax=Arachis hypogaea TaxID=3818 RepID=UPI000DECCEA2|nr:dof zinc finger protein DOF2.5 [Arachis hypogaea]XP_025603360.1 dof zinc finger protein DOF2.5 [Arachis hypogaea]QHO45687.1 Dof zinc finger protein [Arachis hypogaea]
MEGISGNSSCTARPVLEKKARPQEQLNCPRCNSTNTKFCYYNNYSLTQPRYFCKTCRRYWTEGGSLRNVPVGGGSRKNKKIISSSASSSSSSLSSSSVPKVPDLNPPQNPNNKMMQGGGYDLNLAFPAMDNFHHHALSAYVEIPKLETGGGGGGGDGSSSTAAAAVAAPSSLSAIELLRSSGMAAPYVHSSLMPNSNALYPSGFPMQEIKPSLGFSLVDGGQVENNDNHNNGRLLFPFGVDQNNKQQAGNNSTGYWTGIIGEGSSW